MLIINEIRLLSPVCEEIPSSQTGDNKMTIAKRYFDSKSTYKDVNSFMNDVRFSCDGNSFHNQKKRQHEFLFKDKSVLVVHFSPNYAQAGIYADDVGNYSSISINNLNGVRLGVDDENEGWEKWVASHEC